MDFQRIFLKTGLIIMFIFMFLGGFVDDYGADSWPEEKVGYGLRLMYKQAQRLKAGMMASNDYRQSDEVLKRWLMKPSYRRFKAQEEMGYGVLADSQVSVIMEYSGSENDLSSLGIRVKARIGDIATASIPLGSLPQIASLEQVSYIKLPSLYRANTGTGLAPVRSKGLAPVHHESASSAQQPRSASGVVVGYVDTGIDWDHPDFVNPGNTTRIKYLLDFSYPGDIDGDGILDGDEDYYGGTLYTEEQINTDLAGLGEVNETDLVGHGTHGASVACGDDASYPGIAPTASLIVVKATRLDGSLLFFSDDIINAIAFIADKADLLGLPYVINLSLGTIVGPHDGSTLEEQAIDALVGDGREGRAVVISGGNSSDNRERPDEDFQRYHHASGQVENGLTQSHDFTIPSYTPTEGSGNDGLAFDIWYQGKDELIIEVESPNGELVSASTGSIGYGSTPDGDILIANLSFPNLNNGDREARIYIDDESGNVPAEGVWTIRVTGKNITEGGAYDIWLFDGAMLGGQSAYLSFNADNEALVAQPGTAYNGITVGAYATMREWIDVNSIPREDVTAELEDISAFSSPGLSRFGRMKPEIASPGERVIGAVSQDAMPGGDYTIWDDHPFGQDPVNIDALLLTWEHGVLQGTSLSAPLVTGIVALLLDADPTLDVIDIRNILINSAEADTYTGDVPNEVWGFGKLNAITTIINNPLMIETGSTPDFQLPDGVVGEEYSYQLIVSGGSGIYIWTLEGGSLPSGLSLSSEGIITGTPDTTGIYSFTVMVDDLTYTYTSELSIDILSNKTLSITNSSLPAGKINIEYSATLSAAGGVPPYTWDIIAGTLPAGLSLNPAGEISGTPTEEGHFPITLEVTDSALSTDTRSQLIVIVTSNPPGKWKQMGLGGAIINDLVMDPTNSNVLYAATTSGVFKSIDGGDNWVKKGLDGKRVMAVAVNSDSTIVYAGTDSNGLWKSTDGGNNWTQLGGTPSTIWSLATDPFNSLNVLVGTISALYKSTDGGSSFSGTSGISENLILDVGYDPSTSGVVYITTDNWGGGGGIYKSTDGGDNWFKKKSISSPVSSRYIAIDPGDSNTLYFATGNGLYKSIDGGDSWSEANNGLTDLYVNTVAVDPSDSNTLYLGTRSDGVFKSVDAAANWSQSGLKTTEVHRLVIDLTSSSTIYAGTLGAGVYKSGNSAATWAIKNNGITSCYVWAISIDPNDSQTIYIGTPGGILKSEDGGELWTYINSGIGNVTVHSIAIDPSNTNILYAGVMEKTSPGVYKSINGGASWFQSDSGLALEMVETLAIDPMNSSTIFAGGTNREEGTGNILNGAVYKSTDAGANWTITNLAGSGSNYYIRSLNFDSSPTAPALYAAGYMSGVWKTTDGGDNWINKNSGLGTRINLAITDPNNVLTLYAGTDLDGVYKTTDGGDNWLAKNSGLADTVIHALSVDTNDSNTVYAGTSFRYLHNTEGSGVFKSANGGDSWAAVNNGITDPNIEALAIAPDSSAVYAGTWGGIFKSTDGGANWNQLTNLRTIPKKIKVSKVSPSDDSIVYAGTMGYGIYKSVDWGNTFEAKNQGLSNLNIYCFCINPDDGNILYAGTEEGIFKSIDSGENWATTAQASGVIEDIVMDDIGGGISRVWAAVKEEGIYISDDGGASFTPSNTGLISRLWVKSIFKEAGIGRVWITTEGGDGIYLSEDNGATWVPKCGVGLTNRNVNISRIWKDSGGTISRIWAGTDNGVYMSEDDGDTWQHLDIGLPPNAVITDITFDPNTNEVFVTVNDINYGGVYRMGQISRIWTAFSDGLTNFQVQSISHDSGSQLVGGNPATAYFVGTMGGGLFGNTEVADESSDLTIVTDSLPDAGLRDEYEQSLLASGGEPPYSWRLQSGSLPQGLHLSSAGIIRGIPTEEGLYSFIIEVIDSEFNINIKSLQINVYAAISPPHQVTTPDKPGGPSTGETNTYYIYSTGGSTCSLGHSVEYRFYWGDGTYSSWSSSTSVSKCWSTTGTYTVKAQARCSVDHNIFSGWSPGKTVGLIHEGDVKELVAGQGPAAASYVRDFYAPNGAVLNLLKAFGAANVNGEVSVAQGDITGDGIPEIVVGQRSSGAASYVRVFKKDGTLLWTFRAFGNANVNGMVNVAVGDVDLDGVGEIIVGQGTGGQSYVRIFEYGNPIAVTTWRAFSNANTSGEVRVAAGQIASEASVGQIITGQGHGAQSYVRVWDYDSPPILRSTFQAFGGGNASGGVDVGVGCFDGDASGRDLIVVGQGGPGGTAAAPAGSYIIIFTEGGSLLKIIKAFGNNNVNGRVTVSGGQADSDAAEEIIVGQAVGGNSYWRAFNYAGSLITTVKAFGAANTSGQVDIAGTRN